jgi:pyruvate/2-oxoglutarate dehydrogenase complex dihydrolipoamide acyltransferase (E2) component
MTIALSSLRVTADMDASGYARGIAVKMGADASAIASSKALGAAMAAQDAATEKLVPGVARLSRSLVDGYGSAANFEGQIRAIGRAADRGLGLDRVNQLLDLTYRKFGLTADATRLAAQGYVSIVPAVAELNRHYSIQTEILDRAAAAQRNMASAQEMQTGIAQRLGIGQAAPSARESAAVFAAQFASQDAEIGRLRAAQVGESFRTELNARLGVTGGGGGSARDSAAVFAAQLDRLDEVARQKAGQIGQNFQEALNRSFGIGGAGATSRGATFSALEEQMDHLAQVAKAKGAQAAQSFQEAMDLAHGVGRAPSKSAASSASVFVEQQQGLKAVLAELEAQAKAVDNLRSKYVPMHAATEKYKSDQD